MENWTYLLLIAVVVLFYLNKRRGLADAEIVQKLLTEDGVIIDVRSKSEFQSNRIEGAINIPLDSLDTKITKQVKGKDKPILLHCLSGTRSGSAKRILERMGYTNVHNLGSLGRARKILQVSS